MWHAGWSKVAALAATCWVLVASARVAGSDAEVQPPGRMRVGADPSLDGIAQAECRMQVVDPVRTMEVDVRDARGVRRMKQEVFSHRDSLHLRDCEDRYRTLTALRGESVRLGLLRMGIPEYNDEQRFLASPGVFGPKVTIFASSNLDGFRFEQQYESHGARGVLAALIVVDTTMAADLTGMPEYHRLGLGAGVNCLWVSYRRGAVPEWRARVTRAGATWSCAEDSGGTQLGVDRQTYGAAITFLDVPAVARFEFDAAERPLLSVKCLTGWCAIGPSDGGGAPAFVPRRLAQSVPALAGLGTSVTVPGWHDEQRLANYSGGAARPGTVRATLIPYTTGIFPDLAISARRLIGYVYLHDSPASTRYTTWGLQQGFNEVYLARDAAGAYRTFVRSQLASGAWSTPVEWTNVFRHEHVDAALVSTARFRWIAHDDGLWVACGQGCCRMDGET